jgi:hypothetical protein
MNVRLTYQSGQQYTERLSNFEVKVSRRTLRVKVSFSERGQKAGSWGYSSWSLPVDKAQLLAHALLTACAGETEPIQFKVEDDSAKAVAA